MSYIDPVIFQEIQWKPQEYLERFKINGIQVVSFNRKANKMTWVHQYHAHRPMNWISFVVSLPDKRWLGWGDLESGPIVLWPGDTLTFTYNIFWDERNKPTVRIGPVPSVSLPTIAV